MTPELFKRTWQEWYPHAEPVTDEEAAEAVARGMSVREWWYHKQVQAGNIIPSSTCPQVGTRQRR